MEKINRIEVGSIGDVGESQARRKIDKDTYGKTIDKQIDMHYIDR